MTVSTLRIRWLAVLTVLAIAVVLSACSDSPAPIPEPTATGAYFHCNGNGVYRGVRFGQCGWLAYLRGEDRRYRRLLGLQR